MATTGRPITELAVGIRTTADAVVASGKARFYAPGTSTPRDVYTDDACTSALTQPATLNAAGQYRYLYALEPVRMVVKNSAEDTTYYDGVVNLNRHDAVYVTSAGFNSGTETTLEDILTTLTTSTGAGPQLKATSTATARNIKAVVYENVVSVLDFGATVDGVTDDTTAIQAAIDYIESLGGGIVKLAEGTCLITNITIDTAGVSLQGFGRGISILKNSSTTGNCVTVNLGSATDSKMFLKEFSVTASTSSSGAAILLTNGDYVRIEDVGVALHRTGFDTDAVTGARLTNVRVESTDDNASAIGVDLGARARLGGHSEIISGTDNGTGVKLTGADARVDDAYTSNFATGINIAAARGRVSNSHVTGPTTGITAGGASSVVRDNYVVSATTGISVTAATCSIKDNAVSSCTTGISVGAVANTMVTGNITASNTTDFATNASATLITEHGNVFTTVSFNASSTHRNVPWRLGASSTNGAAAASDTWTPTHNTGIIQTYVNTYGGGGHTVTIASPTTTAAMVDDIIVLRIIGAAAQTTTMTWNAIFLAPDGTAYNPTGGIMEAGDYTTHLFRWDGTNYVTVMDLNEMLF